LGDELLAGGVTIIEPGLDHFYRDPDINEKSLALANITVENLKRGAFSPESFRGSAVDRRPFGNSFPVRGRLR
jgi:hypothetical protein